jgi:16S rRNA (guanine527-N7)-methyltransferase
MTTAAPATPATPNESLAVALTQGLSELGVLATTTQHAQLLAYLGLIAQWNKVYNLTSIRAPADMLTHHILDSLAVIPALRRTTGGRVATLLDVGAGAGLPGVVIAIMCPEIAVTSIDTVAKKAAFMTQVAVSLKLANYKAVHGRVESWRSEGFDIVTSRAFSSLQDFVTWTKFHVKLVSGQSDPTLNAGPEPLGLWMAMKGKHPEDELAALPATVKVVGIETLKVPGMDADRCLVWMRPH